MKTVVAMIAAFGLLVAEVRAEERATPLDLDATAAAHFELGAQAYAAKQWDAARAEFQVCFELSKRTDLLHNLSLVAEKQGRVADAAQLERDFRARTQLTEPEREEATKRIARLEGQASAPAVAVAPIALTAAALPSPHVGSEGAAAPRHPGRGLMIAGFGTGGVLLLAAGGLGIAGQLAKNSLESHPITLMELEAGRMSAVAYQAGTIALAVVGSACVVGSAVVAAKRR